MAAQISTEIRAVSVISPKRDEVSTPAEQNAFVVSAETTYDEIALQLVSDMNSFGGEANILSTEVSANATSAEQDALTAQSVVNSKGAWSGLTGSLDVNNSVTHTGSVWVVNVLIPDVTLSEPTDVNTDWTEVSGVTQAELDAKADIDSPTFTGTVGGIDKTMVGLSNVDNTSDANKPVSTAQQAALDEKIDESSIAQTKIGDLTIGEEIAVTSWSFSGTTITVNTTTNHNLIVGKIFYISGLVATTNAPNGTWTVATVEDTDTITFTATDTPTGSPTVSSALLTSGLLNTKSNVKIVDFGTIVNNNRYVIDNPFGNANYEGCTVRLQIQHSGKWFTVGFGTTTGPSTGNFTYGAIADSMAEGIVIQTAATYLTPSVSNAQSGDTYGDVGSSLTSAPCRAIVTYTGEAKDA